GQAENLTGDEPHVQAAKAAITAGVEGLGRHYTHDTIRTAEAIAADFYWRALQPTPIQFAKGAKVPDHWRHLGMRHSPLTNSPRSAVTPGHALLNYLYALLEGETRTAIQVAGLDPALGFNHQDKPYRASLASDIMEACRPAVDRWLLQLLERRTFTARDFGETREGVCRLSPELAQELVETLPLWAAAVKPFVQLVISILRAAPEQCQAPLAHVEADARTMNPRRTRKSQLRDWSQSPVPAAPAAPLSRVCALCHNVAPKPLSAHDRWFCSQSCADGYATLAGYAVILEDRSTWTPDTWAAIWPALRRVPQPRIREALGCSSAMSSFIVNGKDRPSPKRWLELCQKLAA
ncbi:MAG TPA: CRISPR-associated endonuclease Cas1, partial [Chloroflexota bacterium]|nr:CRISPR-associated endonuclease Cas1 [Chloroflexota bacterium]